MSVYLGWVIDESGTERTFKYPFNKYDATAAPGVNDDTTAGFEEGSLWVDVTADAVYTCADNSSGAAVWVEQGGSGSVTAPLDLEIADAATDTVVYPLALSHTTSSTAADDFGVGMQFKFEDAGGTKQTGGQIVCYWGTLTGPDEAHMDFQVEGGGGLETMLRLEPGGNRVILVGTTLAMYQSSSGNTLLLQPTGSMAADRTITFPDATGTVALSTSKLSAFAATTSAELAGVISDETGSGGALVFASSPTITTPTIASFANATHNHQNAAGGGSLDAAAIGSGTMATDRLGSGTANATTFLRGDQSYTEPIALTPCFIAYPSGTKTATTLTFTKIDANTELLDTNSFYDKDTNYRFTPTIAGKYLFYGLATVNDLADAAEMVIAFYKNGSEHTRGQNMISGAANSDTASDGLALIDMNGSTDYVEFFARHSHGSDRDFKAGTADCFWMGFRVR